MKTIQVKFVQEDHWTISLVGDIAFTNLSEIEIQEVINALDVDQITQLIIDLTGIERLDSYGFRVLLSLHRGFNKVNIPITLDNPNAHLRRLLRIMQFDHLVTINSEKGNIL